MIPQLLAHLPLPTRQAGVLAALAATLVAVSPPVGAGALAGIALAIALDFRSAQGRGAPAFQVEAPARLAQGQVGEAHLTLPPSPHARELSIALGLDPELSTERATGTHRLELPAGEAGELHLPLAAHRRGTHRLSDLFVRTRGPAGLARAEFRISLDREVLVLPGLLEAAREHARAERSQRRSGLRRSRRRGDGGSFESLVEYVRGDDPRRLDWKASARHRTPIVRRYESERSQNLVLCLDVGRAMAERTLAADPAEPAGVAARNRLDHACEAASVLSRVARTFADPTGLFAFSDSVHLERPPDPRAWKRIPELLADLRARPVEPDYPSCLARLDRLLPRRSLVVLFSDLLDPIASEPIARALRPLARRHLVVLVALRNPELEALAAAPAPEPAQALSRAAACELLGERERALAVLRERGVSVLDVAPGRSVELAVARYLDIKASGAL